MKTNKLLWGFLMIGCGLLLLLSALGVGAEYGSFRIISSAILLGIAITSAVRLHFFPTLFSLSFIVYLWRIQLGFPHLNLWLLLAAACAIGIGLSVIFRKKPESRINFRTEEGCEAEDVTAQDHEVIHINANFGEYTKYIHAENLKQVQINCLFSSLKVYFDSCQPFPEGLVIHVNCNFGSVVLNIPKSWLLQNQISAFAAEVSDREGSDHSDGCKVILKGTVNFAEVKIVRV